MPPRCIFCSLRLALNTILSSWEPDKVSFSALSFSTLQATAVFRSMGNLLRGVLCLNYADVTRLVVQAVHLRQDFGDTGLPLSHEHQHASTVAHSTRTSTTHCFTLYFQLDKKERKKKCARASLGPVTEANATTRQVCLLWLHNHQQNLDWTLIPDKEFPT